MPDNVDDGQSRLSSLSEARQGVYAFLSNAFAEPPSSESLAALRDEAMLKSAGVLFDEARLPLLRKHAGAVALNSEIGRQARQEFMRLLKVPGGQYITPYESVVRDTRDVGGRAVKGLMMGQSAAAVQKWYKLEALDLSEEFMDLPDHIGLELNYLAHLCGREREFAAAEQKPRLTRTWEMERDFLAAHVVSWIVTLRDTLYEKSQHPYFRAVVDLAVDFTNRDLTTLEGVVGPSDGKPEPRYERMP